MRYCLSLFVPLLLSLYLVNGQDPIFQTSPAFGGNGGSRFQDRFLPTNERVRSVTVFPQNPPGNCIEYMSADVPKNIADNGQTASQLVIPDINPIASIEVINLIGTHTYISDLVFVLVSPQNLQVAFMGAICGNGDDFSLAVVSDNGAAISCPLNHTTPVTQVTGAFSNFARRPSNGTWLLGILDTAGGDTGVLQSWGVRICSEPAETVISGVQTCYSEIAEDGLDWAPGAPTVCNPLRGCSGSGSCPNGITFPVQPSQTVNDMTIRTTAENVTSLLVRAAARQLYAGGTTGSDNFVAPPDSAYDFVGVHGNAGDFVHSLGSIWRSVPCLNGGTFNPNTRNCDCPTGFFGYRCQLDDTQRICRVWDATGLPQPIPDNNPAGVVSTIEISIPGIVSQVQVRTFVATHTWVSDITARLASPRGTQIILLNNDCGSSDNVNIVGFSDNGFLRPCPLSTNLLSLPDTGRFEDFVGEDPVGNWTLTVSDAFAQDTGTLISWSLRLCIQPTDTTGTTGSTTGIIGTTGSSTTGIPASTTGIPASTTGNPASTTGNPASTTGNPASTTGNPASTTGIPASTTGTPASTTGNPATSTTATPVTTTTAVVATSTSTTATATSTTDSPATTTASPSTTGNPATTTASPSTTGNAGSTTGVSQTTGASGSSPDTTTEGSLSSAESVTVGLMFTFSVMIAVFLF